MDEFFVFYALKVVEIAAYVLVIAFIVGMIEKVLGVDTTPKIERVRRAEEQARALEESRAPAGPA